MPNARTRIVVEELGDERELPIREPAPELVFAGTGPERGAYEDARANDNAVAAEYFPPRRGRAA